jgi:hypothetical protein
MTSAISELLVGLLAGFPANGAGAMRGFSSSGMSCRPLWRLIQGSLCVIGSEALVPVEC